MWARGSRERHEADVLLHYTATIKIHQTETERVCGPIEQREKHNDVLLYQPNTPGRSVLAGE